MHLTLSLTHDCNLACSYCYAGTKKKVSMQYETACAGIDLALSSEPDRLYLGFFGGEPLLEWDLLVAAFNYASLKCSEHSISLRCSATTNGSLLTEEKVRWFDSNNFENAVSLDGSKKMHDVCRHFVNGSSSFEQCVNGLKTALKSKPFTEVIIVVTPANVLWLSESIMVLYSEYEVKRIVINPDYYTDWSESDLQILKIQIEKVADIYLETYRGENPVHINILDNKIIARIKNGLTCGDHCNFGRQEFAIAPSGNIYPCERLIGDDTSSAICLGTVFEGFDEQKLQSLIIKNRCDNPECASCVINYICQSTCGCVNYALTGDINRTDGVVCFFEQLSVEAADRAANILFNEGNGAFLREFYGETSVGL